MRTFAEIIDTILSCDIVCNIGQISKEDVRLLDKAAKAGAISKGKGGVFPAIKTVYAPVGFDFIAHRNAVVDLAMKAERGEISDIEYLTYRFNISEFIK